MMEPARRSRGPFGAALAAVAMLAAAGCDPTVRFRSEEGRFEFSSPGPPPPTVGGDLGPSPAFVAGSRIDLDIVRYCPQGFGGECVAGRELNACVRFEPPPGLPFEEPDAQRGVEAEVEVVAGIHRIPMDARGCDDVAGTEVHDDALLLRGVPSGEVTVTFPPEWMPMWNAVRAASGEDGVVVAEGVAHGAVPAPVGPEDVVPVGPGSFSPPILLRDLAGTPLATDLGFVRFATLEGRPTYRTVGDTNEPVMEGAFDDAWVRLHEGDRIEVTVEAARNELGAFEVEVVPPERVVSVELAVAYVPVGAVEDNQAGPLIGQEGILVAAAAVRDDQGRMLRSGDVRFEVEGAGFEGGGETFGGGLAVYDVDPLGTPRSLRCATVTASVGAQRDATQICWEPPARGCACTTGAPAPAGLLPGLGLLLALPRRRRREGTSQQARCARGARTSP
ncbi:MAG: hypothetical protein D6705_14785 [Deltaproteobacteria bacterium]|nr:MAG: hypothetical protein D6705_14785 [Deltaproteobacteria bacterium]